MRGGAAVRDRSADRRQDDAVVGDAGYRRTKPPVKHKLGPFIYVINAILAEDGRGSNGLRRSGSSSGWRCLLSQLEEFSRHSASTCTHPAGPRHADRDRQRSGLRHKSRRDQRALKMTAPVFATSYPLSDFACSWKNFVRVNANKRCSIGSKYSMRRTTRS